jgi:hypothetical protein
MSRRFVFHIVVSANPYPHERIELTRER